jgi:hypothetical protein
LPIKNFDGQFIKANTTKEEAEDKDILGWLYKDEDDKQLQYSGGARFQFIDQIRQKKTNQ